MEVNVLPLSIANMYAYTQSLRVNKYVTGRIETDQSDK